MKNLIKIALIAMSLTLFSAMVVSAQEHDHMNKSDKDSKHMVDTKSIDKNGDGFVFECPMKCEVATDKPGECSKCGMDLKQVKVSDHASIEMKCDSTKKGCCGDKEVKTSKKMDHSKMMEKHGDKMNNMKMNHENMDKSKMENHSSYKSIDKNNDGIVYECPMKCEPASDKHGDCSKCGMKLKEIKTK